MKNAKKNSKNDSQPKSFLRSMIAFIDRWIQPIDIVVAGALIISIILHIKHTS